jgi:hypothetical protein
VQLDETPPAAESQQVVEDWLRSKLTSASGFPQPTDETIFEGTALPGCAQAHRGAPAVPGVRRRAMSSCDPERLRELAGGRREGPPDRRAYGQERRRWRSGGCESESGRANRSLRGSTGKRSRSIPGITPSTSKIRTARPSTSLS